MTTNTPNCPPATEQARAAALGLLARAQGREMTAQALTRSALAELADPDCDECSASGPEAQAAVAEVLEGLRTAHLIGATASVLHDHERDTFRIPQRLPLLPVDRAFATVAASKLQELPAPPDIVKGLLPAGGVGFLYAAPAAGKSFMALDMAARVSLGLPWQRRRTRRGPVLYVVAEGAFDFRRRVRAWGRVHGHSLDNLRVMEAAPNLTSTGDQDKLAQVVEHLQPSLVVLDTLARVTAGADENNAASMGLLMNWCSGVAQRNGCHILLIAHAGKDVSKGMRGSSALLGAGDVVIQLAKAEDGITARLEKGRRQDSCVNE